MQTQPERPELVRCLACRALYEQAVAPARSGKSATCPHCGDVAWLAARIPIRESGALVHS